MSIDREHRKQNCRKGFQYWAGCIEEWKKSGVRKSIFCRERGINYNNFVFHCARERKKSAEQKSGKLVAMKVISETQNTPEKRVLCSISLDNFTLNIHDNAALSFILERYIPNAVRI